MASVTPAAAVSGVGCHCFRDRSFDAANPSAVDPYLLASTQNSLLSAVFGISKKDVVRAKMTGADGDQLWVSQYLAGRVGHSADELLKARSRDGSWSGALHTLGDELPPALRNVPQGDSSLAAAVVDAVLILRLGSKPPTLQHLRAAGASNAEVIAAVYLGLRAGRDPKELLGLVRSGATSWGSVLDATGLSPDQIEEDLVGRLR